MFFGVFGVLGIGLVMNLVVFMVVLLSFNFGLYLMGCVLCLLLMGGFVFVFFV